MLKKLQLLRKNRKKVLGLNERYLEYIRPHNLRNAFYIADDKIITKKTLSENNIPVPEAIAVIRNYEELAQTDFETLPKSFVIKPTHGTRGSGVEIFYNRDKNGLWIQGNGKRRSVKDLVSHCRDILDGKYSLHNEPDNVLIEERVRPHKAFRYHTYKGTPDVRVFVFNSIPVMAMLRLPTEYSSGKANLDQGAIGAGIDMAVGKTTTAIIGKRGDIERVPHTKVPVSGLRIPYWDTILKYSIEGSRTSGLGFCALDFLVDKEKGPLVIELNARGGLSIQLANNDGLRARLRKASGIKVKNIDKGIRLSKDLFGGEIEEGIENISGKQVIGFIEYVNLFKEEEESKISKIKAKVDTGATISSIDISLAKDLGFEDAIKFAEPIIKQIPENIKTPAELRAYSKENNLSQRLQEHPDIVDTALIKSSSGINYRITVNINMEISGTVINSNVNVTDRSNLIYKVLIGKRDLRKFLIDPGKKLTSY